MWVVSDKDSISDDRAKQDSQVKRKYSSQAATEKAGKEMAPYSDKFDSGQSPPGSAWQTAAEPVNLPMSLLSPAASVFFAPSAGRPVLVGYRRGYKSFAANKPDALLQFTEARSILARPRSSGGTRNSSAGEGHSSGVRLSQRATRSDRV